VPGDDAITFGGGSGCISECTPKLNLIFITLLLKSYCEGGAPNNASLKNVTVIARESMDDGQRSLSNLIKV
jgi:hypothetical protein